MAAQFDAVSSAHVANSGITTLTWTHTPVGTPTAVGVVTSEFGPGGGSAISGVTYGGTTMGARKSTSGTGTQPGTSIWGLANPPSGAQSVVVTMGGTGNYVEAAAVTVTGSDTITVFSNANSATGTSTTPSVALTTGSNDFAMDILGTTTGAFPATPGGSQTSRWGPLTDGGDEAQGSTAPSGGATTTMSWTITSNTWALSAAAFKGGAATAAIGSTLILMGVG